MEGRQQRATHLATSDYLVNLSSHIPQVCHKRLRPLRINAHILALVRRHCISRRCRVSRRRHRVKSRCECELPANQSSTTRLTASDTSLKHSPSLSTPHSVSQWSTAAITWTRTCLPSTCCVDLRRYSTVSAPSLSYNFVQTAQLSSPLPFRPPASKTTMTPSHLSLPFLLLATAASAHVYERCGNASTSSLLYPTSVVNVTGTVTNASSLLSNSSGHSILNGPSSVTYDFGRNTSGAATLQIGDVDADQYIGLSAGSNGAQWFSVTGPVNLTTSHEHDFRYLSILHNTTGGIEVEQLMVTPNQSLAAQR